MQTRLTLCIALAAGLMACPTTNAHPGHDPVDFATQLSHAFQTAAKRIKPSVVRIGTGEVVQQRGERRRSRNPYIEGTGSGLVISEAGDIVTNFHVVANADIIMVTLHDGRQFEAEPIGLDREADLAVIRIDATDLVPAEFSDEAEVGQWVLAVGSPFGLSHSYSAGIISGTGRSNLGLSRFEHMIQTDAAINPGNSGGPLIDLHGRVIGLNAAIKTTTGNGAGVGFAIPVDMVRRVTDSLVQGGRPERGYFGITLGNRDPAVREQSGAEAPLCFVRRIVDGLPADKAGMQAGDIIVAIANKHVRDLAEVQHAIAVLPPDSPCSVTIQRNNMSHILSVTPTTRPSGNRLPAQSP
jgi:serine protease Do